MVGYGLLNTQLLPHNVQNNYAMKVQLHEKLEAQRQMQIQRASQGYIPTDGAMITCQMYVNNPKDPQGKPNLVRVPYTSLNWLLQQLESQGQGQNELASMNQGAQQQVAGMMTGPGAPPPTGPMHKPMVPTQPQIARPGAGMQMGGNQPGIGPRPGMAPSPQPMRPPQAGMPPMGMRPGMAGAMNGRAGIR